MKTHSEAFVGRRGRAQKFDQINTAQNRPRLEAERRATAQGIQETFETADPEVRAWVDAFMQRLSDGERQKDVYFTEQKARALVDGAPIANIFTHYVERYLGKGRAIQDLSASGYRRDAQGQMVPSKNGRFEYRKEARPFNMRAVADVISGTRREAAAVSAFSVLMQEREGIKLVVEQPTWYTPRIPDSGPVDVAPVRAMFPDVASYDRVLNESLRRALPAFQRAAAIDGVATLVRHLRIYTPNVDMNMVRQAFATPKRRREFLDFFRTAEPKEVVEMLEDYEQLFGQVTVDQFEALVPQWRTLDPFRYYRYDSRFKGYFSGMLKAEAAARAKEEEPTEIAPVLPVEPEATTESVSDVAAEVPAAPSFAEPSDFNEIPTLVPERAPVLAPAVPGIPFIDEEEFVPMSAFHTQPRSMLERRSVRAAVFATLLASCAGAATTAGLLVNRLFGRGAEAAQMIPEKLAGYPKLDHLTQTETTHANNLAPEFIHSPENNDEDFFAVPEFHGMRTTEVYTAVATLGTLSYDPQFVFEPDPRSITAENSIKHVVAERAYSQNIVLHPPEMGKIDPDSIYVRGVQTDEFTVTPGPLGQYVVELNEESSQPLVVVYEMYAPKVDVLPTTDTTLDVAEPFMGTQRANVHSLFLQKGEDPLAFARRAERVVEQRYRYPHTQEEHDMSFSKAESWFIGDCDVANTDLMRVLQANGIPAEMVGDTDPVPGREAHGQLRAQVYSPSSDRYFVVSLNATPGKYTEEGYRVQDDTARETPAQTITPQAENDLHAELRGLVGRYAEDKYEMLAEETPVLGPIVDTGISEDPQTDVASRDTGESFDGDTAQDQGAFGELVDDEAPTAPLESVHRLIESTPQPNTLIMPPDEMHMATQEEWNALKRGLYGYSELLLEREGLLPESPAEQEFAVNSVLEWMIPILQDEGVIPIGMDPYVWSRHISTEDAMHVVTAMRTHNEYHILE